MGTSLMMPRYSKSLYVEGQLAVQRGRGGHADVGQQQRVAVGVGARHLGRADGAAGAGGVVDHDGGAAQRLAQRLAQVARHLVGGTARGKGHDDGDGLARGRKVGGLGAEGQHGGADGQAEGVQTGHGRLLVDGW
jgi:hypothetical protein